MQNVAPQAGKHVCYALGRQPHRLAVARIVAMLPLAFTPEFKHGPILYSSLPAHPPRVRVCLQFDWLFGAGA